MRGILLSPMTFDLGQIGHVHLAEERQHVVLAHAEELDVLHHHHLVVLHFVERAVDDLVDVHAVAAGQELAAPCRRAPACRARPSRVGIFAQLRQHLADQRREDRLFRLRAHHFHDCFIRFHRPSLQRCCAAVSAMRIFSSRGHSPGNAALQFSFNRRQISTARFSEVGTTAAKRVYIQVQVAMVERRQHLRAPPGRSSAPVSTARPVASSSGPRTLTSTT